MVNEYYYLNELEIKMEEFLETETCSDNDLGWIAPMTKRRMAEAAFAVLKNAQELNIYLEREGVLNL